MSAWRMAEKCDNCPFASSGPGLRLRKSLRPARWREITQGLLQERHFYCHKTATWSGDEDEYIPNGKELVCAGAIEWVEKRGVRQPQYVRICKRISGE